MVLKNPCRIIHNISKIPVKHTCHQIKEVTINRRNNYRHSEESSETNVTANLLKMMTIQLEI